MASQTSLWWQRGIIYQVYPRSFQDSNGDGIGDLQGIISQLDYLSWLGVDAIWISPFYPSPMTDFGYDISDYCNVDPIFGDLETCETLIEQAHQRDLKLIIDFVPNHTSSQHPWFLESRSARQNSRRDWYIWADPKPDGSPPNNWLSVMGGSAWEWDESTAQYYLHTFLKEQPDLNWRNPVVKAAMFDVVRFWLERGIDGFRVDAAHFILKDPDLRDNPLNLSVQKVLHKPMGDYDKQLHLYDNGHADVHRVYRELHQLLDQYGTTQPRVLLGEIHIIDKQVWASYYGADLDEFHMPFNFDLLSTAWNARSIRRSVDLLEGHLKPGAWPNYVLGNHDEPRLISRIGPTLARLAMLFLLTVRGTPTLYYGDEIGMHDGDIPPERLIDPMEKNQPGIGLGRDPERTPMQWNTEANAGFCPADVEPWLPLPTDYPQVNVALEREDPRSLLMFTRRLIQLRHASSALSQGSYRALSGVPVDCFVYLRESDDQRFLIALNFSEQEQLVNLPALGSGQILLSTYLDREEGVDLAALSLRGAEGCVLTLENR
ncbi:MAG TPA: alpha-amylase family glycosyl hydrolase [Ktedonobacteraceae bacterium]|nr:alpha-amylase family glycosyl hydrolase [Ktedonobacteraceae bacterium]